MAVLSYADITLPDGNPGHVGYHDDGTEEYFDTNWNSLGYGYDGATPVADAASVPSGGAILAKEETGYPLLAPGGAFLAVPLPAEGTPTSYDTGIPTDHGHTYLVPSVTPSQLGGGAGSAAPTANQGYDYTGYGGNYSGGGYASRTYGGGGYTSGYGSGYSGGYVPSYGSGGGSVPTYANGMVHPAFGGSPLTPGGQFAQQSNGYDNRQQVSVPGGAAAGPFETRAAYAPHGGNADFGGSGGGGGGGGGGGSLAKSLYWQFRNKIEGKLSGMGQPNYRSSYGKYPSYPKSQQGKYVDYSKYQPAYKPPKMSGYSKNFDPNQAAMLESTPSMLLPKVAPKLSQFSPRYSELAAQPAWQMGLLAYGTQGNGKNKHVLSEGTNALARYYDDVANDKYAFDYYTLLQNLTKADKKSPLGAQFTVNPYYSMKGKGLPGTKGKFVKNSKVKKNDYGVYPGQQVTNLQNTLNALFTTTLNQRQAETRQAYANILIDKYGANNMGKHAAQINQWVGSRLMDNRFKGQK